MKVSYRTRQVEIIGLSRDIVSQKRKMKKKCIAPGAVIRRVILSAAALFSVLFFCGCTLKDICEPIQDYFYKEAEKEEESGSSDEEPEYFMAQLNKSNGEPVTKSSNEAVTVMVAEKKADGGELQYNEKGELQTYPAGEIATYRQGSAVTDAAGETMTYAGGEKIRDIFGLPEKDDDGLTKIRAAGEPVTHGEADIILDENGQPVRHNGEPVTHAEGDKMYDESGELVTVPVAYFENSQGEQIVKEVELVTDDAGEALLEADGEAATKVADPELPWQIYETVIEEGTYYIGTVLSEYMYFGTAQIDAASVQKTESREDEGFRLTEKDDSSQTKIKEATGQITNLQLDVPGKELGSCYITYDREGYAIIALSGTDLLLTVSGEAENVSNVYLEERTADNYPQFKYWDDAPEMTVCENQKWIIKEQSEGRYMIVSAMNENMALTVDNAEQEQYANICLEEMAGREEQLFYFTVDTPVIEHAVEEGNYYIATAMSDFMLMSAEGGGYYNGSAIKIGLATGYESQLFTISYDEYGWATIAQNYSEMVLSVPSEAVDFQGIAEYASDDGLWQKWLIEEHEGGYVFRSALNLNKVMDVTSEVAKQGESVNLYQAEYGSSQLWSFLTYVPNVYDDSYMDDYAQNFSSDTEYLILVNSTTNRVGVYTGSKGNWQQKFYWICTTGKSSTPTIKGEFTVQTKGESFDGNEDSPKWYTCYYVTGIYQDYFFHSIIYNQGTWDVMDATLGVNASHGCVRLETENAKWLYENIPYGTKIVSY